MLMIMIIINKSNLVCNLPPLLRFRTSLQSVTKAEAVMAAFFTADQLWDDWPRCNQAGSPHEIER